MFSDLDWRWLKSFLAVADAGGMHAAAQGGGSSQPTLSRHVAQLEEALGVSLFLRSGRHLVLSSQGAELYELADEVRRAVTAFERQAGGLTGERAGSVRVTMSLLYATYFAPEWIVALRRIAPQITIDLVAEDTSSNLLLGEAEIAVRLFEPKQLDLRIKRCGAHTSRFFASPSYLACRGEPEHADQLIEHDLIGFDRITAWIESARALGYTFAREDFACRSDCLVMHAELARAGAGLAVLPSWVGERAELRCVLPQLVAAERPVYLAAHLDSHKNPRVLQVWNHLSESLTALL